MTDFVHHQEGKGKVESFRLWKGSNEDKLSLRKGLQHMPGSKAPPPTHDYSYPLPGYQYQHGLPEKSV